MTTTVNQLYKKLKEYEQAGRGDWEVYIQTSKNYLRRFEGTEEFVFIPKLEQEPDKKPDKEPYVRVGYKARLEAIKPRYTDEPPF